MSRVELQCVDAPPIATGLEGRAAHVATDLVPLRTGSACRFEANLVIGTGRVARPAVVAIALQLDALPAATGLTNGTGEVAFPAMPLVGVEVEAFAAALVAAILAAAFAAPAIRPDAAIGVPIAILPFLLAVGCGFAAASCQRRAEGGAEEDLHRAPARGAEHPRQRVES